MTDRTERHCDEYIDDEGANPHLRAFLAHARAPAHGALLGTKRPPLFAMHEGHRVRVVMASRFGDVGITSNLNAERGYDKRVFVNELDDFGSAP